MIIVDTNILVYLYIQGEHTSSVESLVNIDCMWVAPPLWRSEFRNVLALYLRRKLVSLRQALDIVEQAEHIMIDNEYQPSSDSILDLVNTSSCSAYDCEFICLAKQFNVPLITQDKKILTEFPYYATELNRYIDAHHKS